MEYGEDNILLIMLKIILFLTLLSISNGFYGSIRSNRRQIILNGKFNDLVWGDEPPGKSS